MKWAVAQGYRNDDPVPAVVQALPKGVGTPKRHHGAIAHAAVGDALCAVGGSQAWLGTKLAFEFMVPTACRSGEVRGATWAEIDGDVWTIPADRMKAKHEHRVPPWPRCVEIVEEAKGLAGESLVFPSPTRRACPRACSAEAERAAGGIVGAAAGVRAGAGTRRRQAAPRRASALCSGRGSPHMR